MPEKKLNVIDFIKGILILAGITVLAIILVYFAFQIILYPLFVILDSNLAVPLKAFIGAIALALFAILAGFGKASGEGFGLAKGYKALKEFKFYIFKTDKDQNG